MATVDVLTSSERLTHYGEGGLCNQTLGGNRAYVGLSQMVIGNIGAYRFGVTVILIHCTFSKAIVGLIEEYSLSCECLERLDL